MARNRKLSIFQRNLVKKFVDKGPEAFIGAKQQTIQRLANALELTAKERLAELEKSGVPSDAASQLKNGHFFRNYKTPTLSKNATAAEKRHVMSLLNAAIYRFGNFVKARTSTVRGAEDVLREQDARIFGADINGNPYFTMDKNTRDAFWRNFNAFKESYGRYLENYYNYTRGSDGVIRLVSETQQAIADMMRGSAIDLTPEQLSAINTALSNAHGLNTGRIDAILNNGDDDGVDNIAGNVITF